MVYAFAIGGLKRLSALSDHFVLSQYGDMKTFKYTDVKKVGRFGPSRSAKLWVPIAATGGVIALLIVVASQTR